MLIKEEEGENECHSDMNPPNPSSSSSTATNRDASDGFETASDGELNDDEIPQQLHLQDEQQKTPSQNDDYVESKQQKAFEEASDVKIEGNRLFGSGQYQEALTQYELALHLAPDMPASVELRSICHLNSAVCFSKLEKYEDAIKECTKALELNPSYMKALLRRAETHEKLEHFEEAIVDMKSVLELDPSNDQAKMAIRRLGPLAEEKREKMKEEMIGKLKEMGNSLLGRFGMSVDNFKSVKDPNTGAYSLSFQR
ncbi:uncharacterized protein [Malus domestica]|nr:tetratricopeptide repeat protein 1-like isoform X3 [Malus domestica]